MLHVEPPVSGAPRVAVLTRGGGRVSHSHGISPTARRMPPGTAATWRYTVSPVPAGRTGQERPA